MLRSLNAFQCIRCNVVLLTYEQALLHVQRVHMTTTATQYEPPEEPFTADIFDTSEQESLPSKRQRIRRSSYVKTPTEEPNVYEMLSDWRVFSTMNTTQQEMTHIPVNQELSSGVGSLLEKLPAAPKMEKSDNESGARVKKNSCAVCDGRGYTKRYSAITCSS